jgi:hypothetical protein
MFGTLKNVGKFNRNLKAVGIDSKNLPTRWLNLMGKLENLV